MAEKLERLKLKRRGQTGVATKLRQEATSLLEADSIEPSSLRRLRTIQGVLREKQAGLKTLDDEITDTCPIDEVDRETIEAEELSGTIVECIDHISSFISEKTERSRLISSASREMNLIEVETVRTNTSSTTISGAPASVSDRSRSPAMSRPPEPIIPPSAVTNPKLPKIELPKFRGDVMKFLSFWESFESSVHQNAGLSAIDKFNYLRALLDGAAACSIQGLALTEGNYGAAIDVLKGFGKPQHIIAGHMKDFMKIPSCTSDKPSQLRSIYDKIYANVRGLEALGIGSEQYGSFLIPIVMDRLPADVCLQIARVTTKIFGKLTSCFRFLVQKWKPGRLVTESRRLKSVIPFHHLNREALVQQHRHWWHVNLEVTVCHVPIVRRIITRPCVGR